MRVDVRFQNEVTCIAKSRRFSKAQKAFPSEIRRRALQLLDVMDSAVSLGALKVPPGNRLKRLSGNRKDSYSVRVNDQWRLTFRFVSNRFENVKLEDYHS